jgi:hypothetical protein
MRPLITLTTDFGPSSPYVAQMKGVILGLCREVDLIDITHTVGSQNVREGAIALADATPRFPPRTIHVAVVDPGVGTARRVVYAEIGGQRYLAPDNGLLSLLAQRATSPPQWRVLENDRYWLPQRSSTFHARDILSPVAANLALGLDPAELGPPLAAPVALDWPAPRRSGANVLGEVLFVDSFGNVITNLTRGDLAPLGSPTSINVQCGSRKIRGLVPTYGAAMAGELVALIDSQDRLEIALVEGHAARELQVRPGDPVVASYSP